MKFLIFLLVSTPAWALSTLDCVSNQGITYSDHNKVGGAHPYPGMITNIEELKNNGVVIFRLVTRESCDGLPCEIQQPELLDVLPPNFSFEFYPATKIVLDVQGPEHDQSKEIYAIQFRINRMPNIWMLCHFERILAP